MAKLQESCKKGHGLANPSGVHRYVMLGSQQSHQFSLQSTQEVKVSIERNHNKTVCIWGVGQSGGGGGGGGAGGGGGQKNKTLMHSA